MAEDAGIEFNNQNKKIMFNKQQYQYPNFTSIIKVTLNTNDISGI